MDENIDSLDKFLEMVSHYKPRHVLEIGTKRSVEAVSTHHMRYFPQATEETYLRGDVEAGTDVDVVCDIHNLPEEWTGRFDAVYTQAVFEHLERPWIATRELYRILKPGGFCYTGTHQTYPLHGFPSDFFRFSKEALALIFTDAGFEIAASGYRHRAKIVPPHELLAPWLVDAWNEGQEAWIFVHNVAVKAPTRA